MFNREILKCNLAEFENVISDQQNKLASPLVVKENILQRETVELTKVDDLNYPAFTRNFDIFANLEKRQSVRDYTDNEITKEMLSCLLYYTQGVKKVLNKDEKPFVTFRTVPSAGARHVLETYVWINKVKDVPQGVYLYLPLTHELSLVNATDTRQIENAFTGQKFPLDAACVFFWTARPQRMEWRYTTLAQKFILLDAGHVCQNLYLVCEALGLGACAMGFYHQKNCDDLLHIDGENEMTIYLCTVGARLAGE